MLDATSYFPSDFSTLITDPLRLQLNEMSGAPLALQVSTPVLPLSEADLAMDGEVSIFGLSRNRLKTPELDFLRSECAICAGQAFR
jgi:hypothetical protein